MILGEWGKTPLQLLTSIDLLNIAAGYYCSVITGLLASATRCYGHLRKYDLGYAF